jgi:hypothetical protein
MKNSIFKTMLYFAIILGTLTFSIFPALASASHSLEVMLVQPNGTMTMGDTPSFVGTITNTGQQPLEGLVVYLSLVSLTPGNEHPVDLEDWSAQTAVRIDRLSPGESSAQTWGMRLIQAGKFAIALTVVDPREKRPVVSDFVKLGVNPKPTLAANQILPIALGEPFLLLTFLGALRVIRRRT